MSLTACHITRVVPDGEQLLVKNKIVREDVHGVDLTADSKNLKQKPAAGIILISEAGGIINDFDLNKIEDINVIASNSNIRAKFLEKIDNF